MCCVCKVRVYVFERVLQRDLGFFEGGNGVSSGDIAYRITAEANDVADTVYAVLNVYIYMPILYKIANFIVQKTRCFVLYDCLISSIRGTLTYYTFL